MASEPAFVIVFTTFPADQDPEPLATALVEEGLAACVNLLPDMRSIYRWKGATERANERQLIIKTRSSLIRELEARIRPLHPYDVPEFLVLPVIDGSDPYLSWLAENTQK